MNEQHELSRMCDDGCPNHPAEETAEPKQGLMDWQRLRGQFGRSYFCVVSEAALRLGLYWLAKN